MRGRTPTRHTETAINYHCRLGVETMHPRFGWVIRGFSVVLTVNSGYE